ncbi:hypothetical protein VARIO8X_110151 [Burkholderiales bacterium 8X]|nr:hypothetical protein VARIO8X_110151 [Burkholderiales bacterium 8X]
MVLIGARLPGHRGVNVLHPRPAVRQHHPL